MLKKLLLLFVTCTFSVRSSHTLLPFNGTQDLRLMRSAVSSVLKNVVNDITDPLVKQLLLSVSREFTRFALRLEFFTIAAGNHFTIPTPTDGMDLEYHKIAAAATFFWQHLSFMELVEEIITNATVVVIQNTDDLLADLSINNETKTYAILKLVLYRVNLALNQDPNLHNRYNLFKMKFGIYFNATRHQMDASHWTPKLLPNFQNWFSIPRIKKFVVNKMFLIQCTESSKFNNNEHQERHLLARSLIQLSKDPRKRREAQKLYHDSVRETADTLVSNTNVEDAGHVSMHNNGFLAELSKYSDRITDNLFLILKDKIENSSTILKHDIETARTTVMKENKGAKYHRIDYWPL